MRLIKKVNFLVNLTVLLAKHNSFTTINTYKQGPFSQQGPNWHSKKVAITFIIISVIAK